MQLNDLWVLHIEVNELVLPTGTSGGRQTSSQSIQRSIQTLLVTLVVHSPLTRHQFLPASLSPLSCGCVLAMIHLTRQHFIRAFRENRGFCHFPESFTLPGAGSTPLASPSRLPSTTLPSAWREERGEEERQREGDRAQVDMQIKQTRLRSLNEAGAYVSTWKILLASDLEAFHEHFKEVQKEFSSADPSCFMSFLLSEFFNLLCPKQSAIL